MVGLLVLQILLAWTGGAVPYFFGGLHPLNAIVILGFLGSITYREWKAPKKVEAPEVAPRPPRPPRSYSGWLWASSPAEKAWSRRRT